MGREAEEAVGPLHTSLSVMGPRSVITYQISPCNLVSPLPAHTVPAFDKRREGDGKLLSWQQGVCHGIPEGAVPALESHLPAP